jgi:peptidoglycan LD-endopeptidase CwlK
MKAFDDVSKRRLIGVHPDMIRVMTAALQVAPFPFRVIDGLRTLERQRELVRIGKSKTMNSRHLPHPSDGLSRAVDIVPLVDLDGDGRIETDELFNWPQLRKLAAIIKAEAARLGIAIEWGGDWKSFPDGPHWQLTWKAYP